MPCKVVNEWNRIRKTDPTFVPNLCATDLEGRDLSGADLRKADLRWCVLEWCEIGRS